MGRAVRRLLLFLREVDISVVDRTMTTRRSSLEILDSYRTLIDSMEVLIHLLSERRICYGNLEQCTFEMLEE